MYIPREQNGHKNCTFDGKTQPFEAKVQVVFDESFQGDEPDLNSHISMLRKRSVDGIFINLSEPALLKVLRALKANRLPGALFSSYGIQGMAAGNDAIRRDIEGLSFSFPPEGRGAAEYRDLFVKRFQSEPVINNYFVRDGISLLVDAASVCYGLIDTRCIRSYFQSGDWRAGMSGRFLIAKDGSITREFEVRRFEGGRPIFAMTATSSAVSEEARAQGPDGNFVSNGGVRGKHISQASPPSFRDTHQ
jgi:hypothetical protein